MAKKHEPEKKIAVEVDNEEEGFKYIHAGADIIQCERFSPAALKAFVAKARNIRNDVIINAAGGINDTNASEYALTGKERIGYLVGLFWTSFRHQNEDFVRLENQ